MTRHERLSLGISTAALVISIGSPFGNYYWFQNEVRIRQLKTEAFTVDGNVYACPNLQTITFGLVLKNTGVWPIENIHLTIQKVVETFDPKKIGKVITFRLDKKDIEPEPPLVIEVEDKIKTIVVRFKDALPPNSDVALVAFKARNVPSDQIDVLPDMESLWPPVLVSSEVSSFYVRDWTINGDGRSCGVTR